MSDDDSKIARLLSEIFAFREGDCFNVDEVRISEGNPGEFELAAGYPSPDCFEIEAEATGSLLSALEELLGSLKSRYSRQA